MILGSKYCLPCARPGNRSPHFKWGQLRTEPPFWEDNKKAGRHSPGSKSSAFLPPPSPSFPSSFRWASRVRRKESARAEIQSLGALQDGEIADLGRRLPSPLGDPRSGRRRRGRPDGEDLRGGGRQGSRRPRRVLRPMVANPPRLPSPSPSL